MFVIIFAAEHDSPNLNRKQIDVTIDVIVANACGECTPAINIWYAQYRRSKSVLYRIHPREYRFAVRLHKPVTSFTFTSEPNLYSEEIARSIYMFVGVKGKLQLRNCTWDIVYGIRINSTLQKTNTTNLKLPQYMLDLQNISSYSPEMYTEQHFKLLPVKTRWPVSWVQASMICSQLNAHLVTLTEWREVLFLQGVLGKMAAVIDYPKFATAYIGLIWSQVGCCNCIYFDNKFVMNNYNHCL